MKRWLSYRTAVEETTLSESTIRRLISEGKFPAPQEITRGRKVFDGAAVQRAMVKLLAERRSSAAKTAAPTPGAART